MFIYFCGSLVGKYTNTWILWVTVYLQDVFFVAGSSVALDHCDISKGLGPRKGFQGFVGDEGDKWQQFFSRIYTPPWSWTASLPLKSDQ